MMPPICRLCGTRHWGSDHAWPKMAYRSGVGFIVEERAPVDGPVPVEAPAADVQPASDPSLAACPEIPAMVFDTGDVTRTLRRDSVTGTWTATDLPNAKAGVKPGLWEVIEPLMVAAPAEPSPLVEAEPVSAESAAQTAEDKEAARREYQRKYQRAYRAAQTAKRKAAKAEAKAAAGDKDKPKGKQP